VKPVKDGELSDQNYDDDDYEEINDEDDDSMLFENQYNKKKEEDEVERGNEGKVKGAADEALGF
jgi:hypothetical protein